MVRKQYKPISSLFCAVLVTSFVTACVKNSSKDTPPTQVKELNIEDSILSDSQLNGEEIIEVKHSGENPVLNLSQTFFFNLTEISEFQIQRGLINNKDCQAQDPFIYSFTLIDEKGDAILMRRLSNSRMLVPGQYKIKVNIENGSLCRDVSMKFSLEMKIREDLVLTSNVDQGYKCFTVVENGIFINNSFINVNTNPIDLKKVSALNNGSTKIHSIIDDENFCERKLPENVDCITSMNPALKAEGPIIAKKRLCRSENNGKQRAKAEFLMSKKDGAASGRLSCDFKRKIIDLKMSDCRLEYRFGTKLPVIAGETSIIIRRGRADIEFSIDDKSEDLAERIPSRLYVNIMAKDLYGRYESLLQDYTSVTRDELMDGRVSIAEPGLRRKISFYKPSDLKIVFSRRRNMISGLHSMSLKETCASDSESIVIMRQGRPQNFCE